MNSKTGFNRFRQGLGMVGIEINRFRRKNLEPLFSKGVFIRKVEFNGFVRLLPVDFLLFCY